MRKRIVLQRRNTFVAVFATLLCCLLFFILQPCLFIVSGDQLLTWFIISPNKEAFSIRFIHSVEKTPVIERFQVNDKNQLQLFATEYQSFGVGLPFLASEGNLTAKDGRFVLEMSRLFPSISLRTGPEAQLTLTANNQQYLLYQMLPTGSIVRVSAGTWLARLTN